ncbi:MAG: DUF3341 domain-containing protein [Planctomycetaceae bacterium]|nr:DUF3341 domain-containing protein [Planctomycetaceae bacterium]
MSSVTAPPPSPAPTAQADPTSRGLVASFSSVDAVLKAVRLVRELGIRRVDVHSPHPIHGLDDALGLKGSPLPWGAIAGASLGFGGGVWMAWWMNAIDYPFLISGKPLFSIIPSLPVAFELAILLAAFAVVGGTLLFGGLPRLSNPRFRVPAFSRATNDRYLLAVDADDEQFQTGRLQPLLRQAGAESVDHIPVENPTEARVPRAIWMATAILLVLALIPPVLIAKARSSTSTRPRLSFVSDMDHQPKFKAQSTSRLFADGRSMRPQVSGTVARGDLRADDRYYLGREPVSSDALAKAPSAARLQPSALLTRVSDVDSGSPSDQAPPSQAAANIDWVTEFPLAVDESLIRRGQQRYGIFCATCHGQGGEGDGLVTLRALELEQGTWVRPTSLHAEPIRNQPVGQLFNSISNGVRRMPGYASQIPVRDRWAIVAYVRALQRTRIASSSDVPEDILPNLREIN